MISLVITVLNEQTHLEQWFLSIQKQSVQPDEIVIVDGGSVDQTWEILQINAKKNVKIKLFKKIGNIAVGRNCGIKNSQGNIIVVTDAGCIYQKSWLEEITKPLFEKQAQFVTTAFGAWLTPIDPISVYAFAASTTPQKSEFNKDWLPSSRSIAFLKEIWHSVGGYPEWLPICEDVVFDLKIKKKGISFFYCRSPLVFWKPRNSLIKYIKQLFYYTRGEGHAGLNLYRQLIRYGVYFGSLFIFIFALLINQYKILFILLGFLIYFWKFYKRWFIFTENFFWYRRLSGIILLPLVVMIGDVAKMVGWLVGLCERLIKKNNYESF